MDKLQIKITSSLTEQTQNFKHFFHAKDKLQPFLPLNSQHFNDEQIVEHCDQLIYRFIKIQDSIGRRLIPLIIEYTESNTDQLSFIDKLNILEKYGVIEAKTWQLYRELRNNLTHTYPEEREDIVESINLLLHEAENIQAFYNSLQQFIESKI